MYSTFHACHHDLLIIWKQNPPKNVSGTIYVSYTVTKLILNCKSMFCLSGAWEGGFYIEATCTLFSSWTWASLTCPPWPAPPPDNWHPPVQPAQPHDALELREPSKHVLKVRIKEESSNQIRTKRCFRNQEVSGTWFSITKKRPGAPMARWSLS